MELLGGLRIMTLVGKHVYSALLPGLEKEKKVNKFFIPAHGIAVFKERPHLLMVWNKNTRG